MYAIELAQYYVDILKLLRVESTASSAHETAAAPSSRRQDPRLKRAPVVLPGLARRGVRGPVVVKVLEAHRLPCVGPWAVRGP